MGQLQAATQAAVEQEAPGAASGQGNAAASGAGQSSSVASAAAAGGAAPAPVSAEMTSNVVFNMPADQIADLRPEVGASSSSISEWADLLVPLPLHRQGDGERAADNQAGNEARGSHSPTSQASTISASQTPNQRRPVWRGLEYRPGSAEDELQGVEDAPGEDSMDVDAVQDAESVLEDATEDEITTEEGEDEVLVEDEEEEEPEPEQEQDAGSAAGSRLAAPPADEAASSLAAEAVDADSSAGPSADQASPSASQENAASSVADQEPVWSAFVSIDRDIPFDFVWQGVQNSVKTVLGNVLDTWQRAGWSNGMDMELSLRRAVQESGIGPVARGLKKADAERVMKMLEGVLTSSMQVDHAGAEAARAIRDASPMVDDAQLRELLQARVRTLQSRISGGGNESPGLREARESLQRMEADLADENNWRRRARVHEPRLQRLERMFRRTDGLLARGRADERLGASSMDLIALLVMAAREGSGRRKVITVDRSNILASALKPVTEASPEDLRPGKVLIRYLGEEGEDGQGGGGVTRAFLSDAGSLLAEPQLGLLLPAPGGHMQLSPLPGFFALGAEDPQSMSKQPERWCRFLGRLLGMAVAHEAPIGVRLAPSLCKQLLGMEPSFEDLQFVPGLNEGGAGWYSSIRNMIGQRSFPSLGKSEASFDQLAEEVVESSLLGLEAVMPSRAQQCFESLALYIGSCVHCPSQWQGAAKVARALLQKATTKAQRETVLNEINKLVRGVSFRGAKADGDRDSDSLTLEEEEEMECGCSGALTPELLSELKSLLAFATGATELEKLLHPLLQGMAEARLSFDSGGGTGSQTARKREFSDLAAEEGIAGMQPSKRAKASTAKMEEDAMLDSKDEADWETSSVVDGFKEDSGSAAELSIEKLPAFAEAVTCKALAGNLQPHLQTIVKEFRSVVPKKLSTSLTWQQVQDRISGKRMDSESFVQEWRDRTTYGSCEEKDAVVQLWWEFVSDQLAADLHRLFTWCTGFAAIPVTPWKFQIKVVDDTRRCPTINTCMTDDSSAANRGVKMPTIYLPAYDSKATLAQKMSWSLAGASGMSLY